MVDDIKTGVDILRAGGLVAFPTETVYGLGADASNEQAVRKIFRAKERPYDHPFIVHLANIAQLSAWAREVPAEALKLAELFWPGPLTIIFKKQPHVLDIVTGDQDTVGIRIPRHPVAQALLRNFGSGLAAPSANKFTHISPTHADAVREELGTQVDLVLDGGPCAVGLESTILDMSGAQPVILRPGMITRTEIAAVLDKEIKLRDQHHATVRVPGMHHLHYAPVTKTVLMSLDEISKFLGSMRAEEVPVVFLTLTPISVGNEVDMVHMPLEPSGYAHDLYAILRDLDHKGYKRIIIERVPDQVGWEGILDRLNKASGRL